MCTSRPGNTKRLKEELLCRQVFILFFLLLVSLQGLSHKPWSLCKGKSRHLGLLKEVFLWGSMISVMQYTERYRSRVWKVSGLGYCHISSFIGKSENLWRTNLMYTWTQTPSRPGIQWPHRLLANLLPSPFWSLSEKLPPGLSAPSPHTDIQGKI